MPRPPFAFLSTPAYWRALFLGGLLLGTAAAAGEAAEPAAASPSPSGLASSLAFFAFLTTIFTTFTLGTHKGSALPATLLVDESLDSFPAGKDIAAVPVVFARRLLSMDIPLYRRGCSVPRMRNDKLVVLSDKSAREAPKRSCLHACTLD